ncbi:MAG: NfeD family protein [Ilumatobacter sp.]
MFAVLDLGLDLDVWPWVWLGVAVVFALIEVTILAGTFVLLPFALSAFLAALAGWYDAPIEAQWSIFVFGGAVLWALFWRYAKRFMAEHTNPEGVGADRLVGMIAIVTATIDPDDIDRRGRVKVAGEDWGALVDGGSVIADGSKVRITSMAGTRVMVEAVPTDFDAPPPTSPPMAPPSSANSSEPSSESPPPSEGASS